MRQRVTVAILTYRRNDALCSLLELLRERLRVGSIDHPQEWAIDLLIIDNDPDQGARAVVAAAVAAADGQDTAQIRYVHEPVPGIAAARARTMEEATASGADLVVFLDDDEVPEPNWLGSLLHTWKKTGAAAVAGRVVSTFTEDVDPWVIAGGFFNRRDMPTGTSIKAAPSGNLLLDVNQANALGIRFATNLGLRGGEDTLFTRQLHHAGGLMVFCRESVVTEPVTHVRGNKRWVLQRVYGHGSYEADLRIRVNGVTSPRRRLATRLGTVGGGLARVGGGVVRTVLGTATRNTHMQGNGVRTISRGLGMVLGAVANPFVEYARKDGPSAAPAGPAGAAEPVDAVDPVRRVDPGRPVGPEEGSAA